MKKKELLKRYILLTLGLFLSALGVAFTKHGELGVSPTSSVANVLSYKFTFFTLGTWLIVWNCVLIVGQILILRKNSSPSSCCRSPCPFCSDILPTSASGASPPSRCPTIPSGC